MLSSENLHKNETSLSNSQILSQTQVEAKLSDLSVRRFNSFPGVRQHSRVGRIQQKRDELFRQKSKLFSPISSTFLRMMRVFPRRRWDMSAHPRPQMREYASRNPPQHYPKKASNCLTLILSNIFSPWWKVNMAPPELPFVEFIPHSI